VQFRWNGQTNAALAHLKILGSFVNRDLILMDASEMNNIVGFIFISAYELFVQAYVFLTFKFDSSPFNKNFDQWIFLNFVHLLCL
jgi:hypothetical protein